MDKKITLFAVISLISSLFGWSSLTEAVPVETIGLIREDCAGYSNCFNSLASWQASYGGIDFGACAQGDLVCADKKATAKIDGAWVNPDSAYVIIDGWTTDVTHSIKIYATQEARHDGKWNATRYRLVTTSWQTPILISVANVSIEGLQVESFDGANATGLSAPSVDNIYISHNIIRFRGSSAAGSNIGIYVAGGSNNYVWNNIVYGFYEGIEARYQSPQGPAYLYNNTSVDNQYYGIVNGGWASTALIKNNIATGNGAADYIEAAAPFDPHSSSNVSGDGTSPDTSYRNATIQFKDEPNEDFHLADNDAGARNRGLNLSSDLFLAFTNDIDGEIRSGYWDIGADESQAPSGQGQAPARLSGAPVGTIAAGTTQIAISLTTNKGATCKYSETPDTAYGLMPNTFSTTGGASHSTTVSGLKDGNAYNYYVRCQNAQGNANLDDYPITFFVAAPGGGRTYYISLAGNDSNPGTESEPWGSFGIHVDGQGDDDISAGDTVYIGPGVYYLSDSIHFNITGDPNKATRIIGRGPGKSIFDGQGLVAKLLIDEQVPKDKYNMLFQNLAFRNTCVKNCGTNSPYGIAINNTHNWTFDDIEVYNIGVAEGAIHSPETCYIDTGNGQAIAFVGSVSENLTIKNSKFHNICQWNLNRSNGFAFRYTDWSKNLLIENNEFWNVRQPLHFHGGNPSSVSIIGNKIGIHPDNRNPIICGTFGCYMDPPSSYDGIVIRDNICIGADEQTLFDGTMGYGQLGWGIGTGESRPCASIRNVLIENNIVKRFSTGIRIGDINMNNGAYSYGNVIVRNNIVSQILGNWDENIGAGGIVVSNAQVADGAMIRLYANSLYNNRVGIYILGSATRNLKVKNNIAVKTKYSTLLIRDVDPANIASFDIDYNLYSNPGGSLIRVEAQRYSPSEFANYQADWGLDGHSLVADPVFVDSANGDFHLKSVSPAIDAGADLSATFTTDFEGDTRPQGAGWDIGADEFVPSGACAPGDVNCDGTAGDSSDIQLVVNVRLGLVTDQAIIQRADLNSDTKVDASDIQAIVNMSLGV